MFTYSLTGKAQKERKTPFRTAHVMLHYVIRNYEGVSTTLVIIASPRL